MEDDDHPCWPDERCELPPFWTRVCCALGPSLFAAFLMIAVFAPVLVLVVQEPDPLPPHVEIIETFWKFSSIKDTAIPFNATVCLVYEPRGNETVEPECSRAPLNGNEFTKVENHFIGHSECRYPHQEVLEGKCRVLEFHPHKAKPRLVMHGRFKGSFLCHWISGKHMKELVAAVVITCRGR